jgi:L,D-transpeptidase YcbB
MTDRKRWICVAGLTLATAACGRGEPATEHIRLTLEGAAPAAVDAPAGAGEEAVSPAAGTVVTLPDGDTVHIRGQVTSFYRERGYEPAWTGRRALEEPGERLLALLGGLTRDGLDPGRYKHHALQAMARALADGEAGDDRLAYLGDLDLVLTEGFARAVADVERGVLDPTAAGLEWRIERSTPDDSVTVARLAAGEDPAAILGSSRPVAPYYERLSDALGRLRSVQAEGGWPSVPAGETLRGGDRDPRVARLRARFVAGEDAEERRLAASGREDPVYFDENLEGALRRFQARHTLHEDGALGPNSVAALNVPVEERIETVRLNLDRWRWLPRDLGEEFLLVNVAGFELELVARDTVLESMSVVVGRTANRTPLFRDTLEYVVVNPYWNVPTSIVREEIIPALREDPFHLGRNAFEVLYDGRVVDEAWVRESDLANGRFLVRQRPGPNNALGNVKFMFPNDMNIYLHDTPAGHLFSQETRAFSYGCIRVERPGDLARTLLDRYSDHDGSEYDRLREKDGEQWVTLDRPIPIYILYFTAWAAEDGTLRFHPDIYERDAALAAEQAARLPPLPLT